MNSDQFAKTVLPASLEITRTLPATREEVWPYLVDPELRKQWFCAGETGSSAGEPFVMDFDHTRISSSKPPEEGCGAAMVITGTIVEFAPPSLLVYDWPGEDESTTTRVTIRLDADGENTKLHLLHERLVSDDFKRGASAGWHAHLDLLIDLVQGNPVRDFWVHYGNLKQQYDAKIE